jgi:thioredoxin 1
MREWNKKEIDDFIKEKRTGLIYLYTPFCGTCQVSGKMLLVAEELLPEMTIGKINLNFMRELAEQWTVESVPCLVFIEDGAIVNKLYAFQSVPYLVDQIVRFHDLSNKMTDY